MKCQENYMVRNEFDIFFGLYIKKNGKTFATMYFTNRCRNSCFFSSYLDQLKKDRCFKFKIIYYLFSNVYII